MPQADFVERGRQLCARAQYQEAVKVCRLGLLAHPTEVEGRLVLGEALLALSRYDEVLAEMRVALELDGENPRALGLKGAALLRKGDVLQASDVLARAVTASPSDPTLRQLYGEARSRREGAMQGRGQPQWGPSQPPQPMGRARDPLAPPPGIFGVGDQSGTIEIDPDVDAVEVRRRGRTDLSEPAIELSQSDLLPEPPAGHDPAPSYGPGGMGNGMEMIDGPFAPRPSARIPPLEAPVDRPVAGAKLGRGSFGPGAMPNARPDPRGAPMGAPLPRGALTQMFPEDESGVSRMVLDAPPAAMPRSFEPGQEQGWQQPDQGRGWQEPGPGPQGWQEPGPGSQGWQEPGPGPQGWQEPERPPQGRGPARGPNHEDMRMIRQGLGLPPDGSAPGAKLPRPAPGAAWAGGSPPGVFPAVSPSTLPPPGMDGRAAGRPAEIPRGRSRRRAHPPAHEPRAAPILTPPERGRGLPLYAYGIIGLVVVAAAVVAGLRVRDIRLSRQIESARQSAEAAAAADTYPGYLTALDAYARIAAADAELAHRAAHAAMAARVTAEFGDGLDQARALVAELGPAENPDALVARGFLAIAEEDAERAQAAASALRKVAPDHPDALHLAGRAALLAGRLTDAAQLLRAALENRPRPAVAVALARAEAEQGRYPEARIAFDRAQQLRPQHPGAIVWGARIAVWSKNFPSRAEPEASLQRIILDGSSRPAGAIAVSPGQAALASLALAEVLFARGDRSGAQSAAAAARGSKVGGFAFRAGLAEILADLGDLPAARAQVNIAVVEWPRAVSSRVLEARVAMAGGDPEAALAALGKAGDLGGHPDAMALRGRAHLATGQIDRAAADLDAALALRPDEEGAILARAEVDLARGEARIARKRLSPLYGDGDTAAVEVVAAYAAALRQSGDRGEARKILAALAGRPREAGDWRVLIEQARLARAEGSFKTAGELYDKAIAAFPGALDARLEAALLAFDSGDLPGARRQVDALVGEGVQSGPVLVEAARVRIASGDHKGATELLDRAAKLPAPSWKVARERGRLLLRQRSSELAATELEKAKAKVQDDGETRLLLMEAYFLSKNRRAAARELEGLTKNFRRTSILALARGFEALTRERWRDAAEEMARAHEMAVEDGESPRLLGRAAYWTGRALYLDDKVAKAVSWLERALQHDRSLSDAHYLLGQIAFEGKRTDQMVRRFERAVDLDPAGNPSAWFFLGEHYIAARRYDQARVALQTYVERWPEADFSTDARDLLSKIR